MDTTLAVMRRVFDAAYIFPMGAVAKPLEPDKLRPTDDHTRTGLNAACDMYAALAFLLAFLLADRVSSRTSATSSFPTKGLWAIALALMLGAADATTPMTRSSSRQLSELAAAFGPDAVSFYGGASSYVNGLPMGWHEEADVSGTFSEMFAWARLVHDRGACALPGVSIKMRPFVAHMWEAVRLWSSRRGDTSRRTRPRSPGARGRPSSWWPSTCRPLRACR